MLELRRRAVSDVTRGRVTSGPGAAREARDGRAAVHVDRRPDAGTRRDRRRHARARSRCIACCSATSAAARRWWRSWPRCTRSRPDTTCAFMAPTEILARQHAATCTRLAEPVGVEVACLSAGTPRRRAQAPDRGTRRGHADADRRHPCAARGGHRDARAGARDRRRAAPLRRQAARDADAEDDAARHARAHRDADPAHAPARDVRRSRCQHARPPAGRARSSGHARHDGDPLPARSSSSWRASWRSGRQAFVVVPAIEEGERASRAVEVEHRRLAGEPELKSFPDRAHSRPAQGAGETRPHGGVRAWRRARAGRDDGRRGRRRRAQRDADGDLRRRAVRAHRSSTSCAGASGAAASARCACWCRGRARVGARASGSSWSRARETASRSPRPISRCAGRARRGGHARAGSRA